MKREHKSINPPYSVITCLWFLALLLLGVGLRSNPAEAAPVGTTPNLVSITFFERTGGTGPTAFTFGVNSSQLTTRLSDPLSASNKDFAGWAGGGEFYDVFYSDADGSFNVDGEFVTIEAVTNVTLADGKGGGLNIAEVQLNFTDGSTEFANFVSSFVALGDNALPSTVGNAVDGNLLTHTTGGNTVGQVQRLRVTVGFTIEVSIDIKPGSDPNSINPRSKGEIPVAILTTDSFDATTVDPTTVRFGPTGTETAPVHSALEDVDGDGDTDLILHFSTQDTGIACGDISAFLTGETFSGQAIEGSDSVNTVGCK